MNNNLNKGKNKKEIFTIEKLRTFAGLEKITDKEAAEVIKTFDSFSFLIFDCFQENINKN